MDAVALHLRRHITNFSMRKDAKVGHLVPAINCIQKGQYLTAAIFCIKLYYSLTPVKIVLYRKQLSKFMISVYSY